LAKARPGQLTFGSAGVGSSNHLSGELLKMMAGIDMLHIPYKGGGAAVTELLGGHISMYFATTPSVMPHVRSGKLRALGVTTAKRSPSVPDVPTIEESGLTGFEQSAWHGLFAPAGTPEPIITKLSAEVVRILRLPDVEQRFAAQGVDIIGSSPAEFAAFIRQDVVKYEKLIKAANIHVE
jgi:tripartite-type tricarboxylate transporter receptor subunit TctC